MLLQRTSTTILLLLAFKSVLADESYRRLSESGRPFGKRTSGIPRKNPMNQPTNTGKTSSSSSSSSGPTPKSCTEEPIIVIGAGASGLAAARDLQDRGCLVTILEARDRIGGRSYTIEGAAGTPFDFPVDMGGMFITGSDDANAIAWLAKKFEIETVLAGGDSTYLGYPEEAIYLREWNGDVISDDTIDGSFETFDYWWYNVSDVHYSNMVRGLGDMPLSEASEYVFNDGVMGPLSVDDQSILDYHLNAMFPNDWGMDTSKVSLAGIVDRDGWGWCPVDGVDAMFKGGVSQMWDVIAAGDPSTPQNEPLDIRLNSVVVKVKHDEKGCVVTYKNGGEKKKLSGSVCLCTVPVMVLKGIFNKKYKEGDIKFDPPLSPEKQIAIKNRGTSYLNIAQMVFETPFWRNIYPGKKRFNIILRRNNDCERAFGTTFEYFTEFIEVNGYKQTEDYFMLQAYYGGDTVWTESLSDAIMETKFLAGLDKIFGSDNVPDPLGFRTTRWKSDTFARGSYAGIGTFSTLGEREVLAAPESNGLRFAGEATHYDGRMALFDGAYVTGVREAHFIAALEWNVDNVKQTSEWMNPNDYCMSIDMPLQEPKCENFKGYYCRVRTSCDWNRKDRVCSDKQDSTSSDCEGYDTKETCKESGRCAYSKKEGKCKKINCKRLSESKCKKKSLVCEFADNECMEKTSM